MLPDRCAGAFRMIRASGLAVSQRAFVGTGSSRALLKAQRCKLPGVTFVWPDDFLSKASAVSSFHNHWERVIDAIPL